MSEFDENTQWACPACTLHNKLEDAKCSVCGGPRPQDATDKLAAKTKKAEEEKRKFQPKVAGVALCDEKPVFEWGCNTDCRGSLFSSDGKYIAVTSKQQPVRIFDAATFETLHELDVQAKIYNTPALAWSCDASLLAVGSIRMSVQVYDAFGFGRLGNVVEHHTSDVTGACFSYDCKALAICSYDDSVSVTDLNFPDSSSSKEARESIEHSLRFRSKMASSSVSAVTWINEHLLCAGLRSSFQNESAAVMCAHTGMVFRVLARNEASKGIKELTANASTAWRVVNFPTTQNKFALAMGSHFLVFEVSHEETKRLVELASSQSPVLASSSSSKHPVEQKDFADSANLDLVQNTKYDREGHYSMAIGLFVDYKEKYALVADSQNSVYAIDLSGKHGYEGRSVIFQYGDGGKKSMDISWPWGISADPKSEYFCVTSDTCSKKRSFSVWRNPLKSDKYSERRLTFYLRFKTGRKIHEAFEVYNIWVLTCLYMPYSIAF